MQFSVPAAWEKGTSPLSNFLFFLLSLNVTQVSIKLSQIPPTSFLDPPALILKPNIYGSNFPILLGRRQSERDKIQSCFVFLTQTFTTKLPAPK